MTPLKGNDLKVAQHEYNSWQTYAKPDTTIEDIETTDFWEHLAVRLNPGDEVRVTADDFSWTAVAFVKHRVGNHAHTKVLSFTKLDAVSAVVGDRFHKYVFEQKKGRGNKWMIKSKADGTMLYDNCASQAECMKWVEDYEKTGASAA